MEDLYINILLNIDSEYLKRNFQFKIVILNE